MPNPTAITKAKKIAEAAARRRLHIDRVWIDQPHAAGLDQDEYRVSYTLPNATGFFICQQRLDLTPEEYAIYEAWAADRNAQA